MTNLRGIEGQGLACLRGGRDVFSGLDLAVPPGRALLLSGPNGSGKTSLIRMLAGLLRPAAGRLTWDGVPIDGDAQRARVAYVGHLDAIKPALSTADNLAFWVRLHGGGGPGVSAALERLGIGHLAAVPARYLSAGQRRRLALARLVAAPAPLWLLDEPTVMLDAESVAAVEALIGDHLAGGGLAVIATHTGIAVAGATRLDLGAP